MAKQLNVSMNFTANTTQAKSQIQELSNLLTKIAYGTDVKINPSQFSQASQAAKELAMHLNNAYNATTGNFDLSRLNTSLTKSGTSVTQLSTKLLQAGSMGQQAFIKLAQSIASADQPMITLSGRLGTFLTTLQNTARWQFSSTILHKLIGSVSSAYQYAQDLNKSLTNIQIVTGKSADEMGKFADQANKAAKALSTTTTKYTDAALIYYQQGLNGDAVKERTEATIKLANVTGQTAEEVSSQLTAVWNNFYDGSRSLESYADAMTALGANTASSSAEIAQGLQKFSSIADTVGLSFDYAATALASVVAKTRESADSVGTSFKTILSRLEGLKLGETLEDDVDLNKYSAALATVGVNVFDANHQLKDMDTILDELGAKWGELDRDQQVALATTVGGARQVNMFMALMEAWQGTFQKNLEIAKNSEGTLDKQAEIYAQSWEAARNRVKAAAQGIYQTLLDDKFFIQVNNVFAEVLDGIDNFIEKAGGLKTVLYGVASLVFKSLSTKINPAIENLKQNLLVITGNTSKVYEKINAEATSVVTNQINTGNYSAYDKQQLENIAQITAAKQRLAVVDKDLTATERAMFNQSLEGLKLQQQEILDTIKEEEALKKAYEEHSNANAKLQKSFEYSMATIDKYTTTAAQNIISSNSALQSQAQQVQQVMSNTVNNIIDQMALLNVGGDAQFDGAHLFTGLIEQLETLSTKASVTNQNIGSLQQQVKLYTDTLPEAVTETEEFQNKLQAVLQSNTANFTQDMRKLVQHIKESSLAGEDLTKVIQNLTKIPTRTLIDRFVELNTKIKEGIALTEDEAAELEKLKEKIKELKSTADKTQLDLVPKHTVTGIEALNKMASSAMSVVFAINSIKSAVQTLKDPDATGWEKWSSSIMAVAFTLPALTSAGKALSATWTYMAEANAAATATTISDTVAKGANTAVTEEANKQAVIRAQTAHNEAVAKRDAAAAAYEKAVAEWQEEEVTKNWDVIYLQNTAAQSVSTNETVKHTAATLKEAEAEVVATGAALDSAKGQIVDAGAKDVNTVSTGILSKAVKGLTTSIKTLYTFLMNNPYILLAAAAIAVLVVAIKGLYNETHKARIEAKEAKEQLDKVTESVNEVKQSIEDVNSRLDALGDKYDKIKSLTRGTAEWRQAVYEVNTEVRELLDLYNLLDKPGMWHWENGAMVLSDNYYKEVEQQQTDQYIAAQQAQSAATQVSDKAEIDAQIEVIKQDYLNQLDADPQATILSIEADIKDQLWADYQHYYVNTTEPLDYNTWYQIEGQEKENQYRAKQLPDVISDEVLNTLINAYSKNPNSFNYSEDYLKTLNLTEEAIDLLQNDKLQSLFNDLFDSIDKFGAKYQTGYQNDILLQNSTAEAMQHTETSTVEAEILSQIFADKMGAELTDAIKSASKELTSEDRKAYAKAAGLIYDEKSDRVYAKDSEGKMDKNSPISDENIANWKAQNELAKEYGDQLANIIDATHRLLNLSKADFNIDVIEKFLQNPTGENKEVYLDEIRENIAEYAELLGVTQEDLQAKLDEDNGQWLIDNAELIGQLFSDDLAVQQAAYAQLYDSFYQDNFAQLGLDITNLQGELQGILDANSLSTEIQLNSDIIGQVNTILQQIDGLTQEEAERILDMFGIKGNLKVWYSSTYDPSTKEYTRTPHFQLDVSNAYLTRPEGTSTGGSPTGSGSDSKKELKQLDDELERYHEIRKEIEAINSALDSISEEKDRAFGPSKIRAMDKEIAKYKELLAAEQQYLAQAQANLEIERAKIESYGGTIDSNGVITNYTDLYTEQLNAYNAAVEQFNNKLITEEEFDAVEQSYEEFKESMNQYEETLQLVEEEQQKIVELQHQIFDAKIEKIQYVVDVNIDAIDKRLSLLQYKLDQIDDDAFEAVAAIENLAKQLDATRGKIGVYTGGAIATLATSAATSLAALAAGDWSGIIDFSENIVNMLSEYRDQLQDIAQELRTINAEMINKTSEGIDAWIERINTAQETLAKFNNVLDYYENTIALMRKLDAGSFNSQFDTIFNTINELRNTNTLNLLKSAREEVKTIQATKAYLEEQRQALIDAAPEDVIAQAAKDPTSPWAQSMRALEEMLENINQQLQDAELSLLETWQMAIQQAQDQYEKTLSDLSDRTAMETEKIRSQFDRSKEIRDLYLNDYDKTFELSKLSRQINESLSDNNIIKNREKLLALEEKINSLYKSDAQLSQHDVEYLQKQYDLRLAEIALEEAQNATNSMRLVRNDVTGNWDYVYTADQDNIDKAAQAYEDKLYELKKFNEDYIDTLSDSIVSLQEEWTNALTSIIPEAYSTTEEYFAALSKVNEDYAKKFAYLQQQMQNTIQDNADLYTNDWQAYAESIGIKIETNKGWIQSWSDTLLSEMEGYDNLSTKIVAICDEQSAAIATIKDQYEDLIETINDANDALGVNENDLGVLADLYTEWQEQVQINEENEKNIEAININTEALTAITEIVSELFEQLKSDSNGIVALTNQITSLEKAIEVYNNILIGLAALTSLTNLISSITDIAGLATSFAFDTGGYTGNWQSSEGRLAVLHEKELVLNDTDTQNILDSVSILRQLSDQIGWRAASASSITLNAMTLPAAITEPLQQQVTISAEFPSVTDRNEIEAAFDSLVNQASQWANRRR